jgi:diguanylate cyclase (GGDEF)-like protein/PAS domain S-box-containing protein
MVQEKVRLRTSAQVADMRYRFMARRKDGSHFHVEVHGTHSTYDNQAAVIGVVIDVTEQIVAEQRIRDRDNKIRTLFSENVIGILSWDAEGNIRDANPAFREMLSLTSEDLAGRGLPWKSITPHEYHEVCVEYLTQIMIHGRGTPMQKEYINRATGEHIPVLVNGVRYSGDDCVGISFVLDLRNTQRIQNERDLLASMVEWAPAAMFVQDLQGRFVYLNRAGHAKGEPFGGLIGKNEFDYMDPATAARVAGDRERIIRTGEVEQFEEEIRYQSVPEPFYYRTTKWPLNDARGQTIGLVGVVLDVCAHKKAQAELARSQNLVNAVFANMPGLAILRDVSGHIISCNNAFTRITGLKVDDVAGKTAQDVLPESVAERLSRHDQHVLSTEAPHLYECEIQLGSKIAPYLITLFPIFDEQGKASVLCSLMQNQEEIRQAQSEREARILAEYQALHDPLTGLPNRKLLFDRLEQYRLQAQREDGNFVVCFLDLNRFKYVNDTYGHEAGDELLKIVAERMPQCLRSSDTLARIGGDEFVVLLRGDPDSEELMSVIKRLYDVVAEPVLLQHQVVTVSCSIGYAVYPKDGTCASELLSHADRRMYEHKAAEASARAGTVR